MNLSPLSAAESTQVSASAPPGETAAVPHDARHATPSGTTFDPRAFSSSAHVSAEPPRSQISAVSKMMISAAVAGWREVVGRAGAYALATDNHKQIDGLMPSSPASRPLDLASGHRPSPAADPAAPRIEPAGSVNNGRIEPVTSFDRGPVRA